MRKVMVAALACLGVAGGGRADTIASSFSCSTLLSCTTARSFDPSLGYLTQAYFSISSYSVQTAFYASSSATPPPASAIVFGTGTLNVGIAGASLSLPVAGYTTTTFPTSFGRPLYEYLSLGPIGVPVATSVQITNLAALLPIPNPTAPPGNFFTSVGVYASPEVVLIVPDRTVFAAQTQVYHGTGPMLQGAITYIFTPVPEPASWLLMLTGFGTVGYSLRRRRASFDTAPAG